MASCMRLEVKATVLVSTVNRIFIHQFESKKRLLDHIQPG